MEPDLKPTVLEVVLLSVDGALFFWADGSNGFPITWIASRWQNDATRMSYADRHTAVKEVESYAEANGYSNIKLP